MSSNNSISSVSVSRWRRVWFITGTSSGLGRELVKAALARGDRVIASARCLDKIVDLRSDSCQTIQLDVTSHVDVIRAAVKQALGVWGYVDIVVNNAGAGIIGFFEELGDDIMQLMKINYFGPINIATAFLPHLRTRRTGTIVFIGSRSSWRTNNPMTGGYCAAKAALNAAVENLSVELAPFNIRVLNVLPGGLRTNNWPSVMRVSPALESGIPDYDSVRRKISIWVSAQSGREVGDPKKAAYVIVDVVRGEGVAQQRYGGESDSASESQSKDASVLTTEPGQSMNRRWPTTLALGYDADRDIREKCRNVLQALDEWKDVACSIGYDE